VSVDIGGASGKTACPTPLNGKYRTTTRVIPTHFLTLNPYRKQCGQTFAIFSKIAKKPPKTVIFLHPPKKIIDKNQCSK